MRNSLSAGGFNVTRFALLALLVTEKDEVDDLGVQPPCRGEVYLDIATGDIQAVAVVHAERHFIEVGVTVVLGDGRPRVPERVIAVVILFFHAHVGAYLAYADIHVSIETVGVAVTAMEHEQVFIILAGQILLESGLYKWFDTHFHICLVLAAVACLGSFIADNAIVVVLLFES